MKKIHHFLLNSPDNLFRFIFQETRKNDEILTGDQLLEYEKDDMPFLDNLRKNLKEGQYSLNMALIKAEMTLETELKKYTGEKNETATRKLEIVFNKILNIAEPILEKNAALTNMMLKDFQQLQIEHFGEILFDPREGNDTKNLLKLTEVQITATQKNKDILLCSSEEISNPKSPEGKNKIKKQKHALIDSLQFILQPGISRHFGINNDKAKEIKEMIDNKDLINSLDDEKDIDPSDFYEILEPIYDKLKTYGFYNDNHDTLVILNNTGENLNKFSLSAKFMQAFAKFIEAGLSELKQYGISTWSIYKEQQTIEVQNLSSKEDFLYVQKNDLKLLPKNKKNEVLKRLNEQIKNTETEIQTAKKDLLLTTIASNLFQAVDKEGDFNEINWDFEKTFSYKQTPRMQRTRHFFKNLGSRVGLNKKPTPLKPNTVLADRIGQFSGDEIVIKKEQLPKMLKELNFSDVSPIIGGEPIDIRTFLEQNEMTIAKKMMAMTYGENVNKTPSYVINDANNKSIHVLQKLLNEKQILKQKADFIQRKQD